MIGPVILAPAGFWIVWGMLHQNNFFLIGGMALLAIGSFLSGRQSTKWRGEGHRGR